MLDAQVAFDPAEEQFDAPPQTVNQRHRQRRDLSAGGENQPVVGESKPAILR
jgi:hypothetical protein